MDYFLLFQLNSIREGKSCNHRRRELGLDILPGGHACIPLRGDTSCEDCATRNESLRLPQGVDE